MWRRPGQPGGDRPPRCQPDWPAASSCTSRSSMDSLSLFSATLGLSARGGSSPEFRLHARGPRRFAAAPRRPTAYWRARRSRDTTRQARAASWDFPKEGSTWAGFPAGVASVSVAKFGRIGPVRQFSSIIESIPAAAGRRDAGRRLVDRLGIEYLCAGSRPRVGDGTGVRDGDASGPILPCRGGGFELHQGGGALQRIATGIVAGDTGAGAGAWRPALSPRAQSHASE